MLISGQANRPKGSNPPRGQTWGRTKQKVSQLPGGLFSFDMGKNNEFGSS